MSSARDRIRIAAAEASLAAVLYCCRDLLEGRAARQRRNSCVGGRVAPPGGRPAAVSAAASGVTWMSPTSRVSGSDASAAMAAVHVRVADRHALLVGQLALERQVDERFDGARADVLLRGRDLLAARRALLRGQLPRRERGRHATVLALQPERLEAGAVGPLVREMPVPLTDATGLRCWSQYAVDDTDDDHGDDGRRSAR